LSSIAGGEIAVAVDRDGRFEPLDSYYEVEVALDDPPPYLRVGQTGTVWLRTRPRSRLAAALRYVHQVLIRESSF
jgi:hypothetical protein